jgi:very-short-patch-repair endonuclease
MVARVEGMWTGGERSGGRWVGYRELRATGWARAEIDAAVAAGSLIRARRGRYLSGGVAPVLLEAAKLGGRLDCVSLLEFLGVFVLRQSALHLQFDRDASRLPMRTGVAAHWRQVEAARSDLTVDVVDAVVQACRCQPPRAALATIDSAWHLGFLNEHDVAEVFARLPSRFRPLRRLVDPRAESGPETLVRLLVRGLGCRVEIQVELHDVGRVDLVVDGWIVIECDSEAHHGGWDAQRRDRRRDLAAAALGYTTIRPIAEDILHHPDRLLAAVKGLLSSR